MGGWRVSDNSRSRKVGIAAAGFDEFRRKACAKLQKNFNTSKFYMAECGTLVSDEDYFNTVKQQTLFVVIDNDIETIETDVEIQFKKLLPANYADISKKVQKLFITCPEQMRHLTKRVRLNSAQSEKARSSKREEHEDWFVGVDKYKTKEEFMKSKAATRMKSYLRRAKSPVNKRDEYLNLNQPLHNKIKDFWKKLADSLKQNDYHGNYFNRKIETGERFCDEEGNFACQGRWNESKCSDGELVNPYASRDERTIFKCWNFDHKLELSRAIVPSIIEGIKVISSGSFKCYRCTKISNDGYLSSDVYYKLLFTRDNLKLVSEICHDKKKHATLESVYVICVDCKSNPTLQ